MQTTNPRKTARVCCLRINNEYFAQIKTAISFHYRHNVLNFVKNVVGFDFGRGKHVRRRFARKHQYRYKTAIFAERNIRIQPVADHCDSLCGKIVLHRKTLAGGFVRLAHYDVGGAPHRQAYRLDKCADVGHRTFGSGTEKVGVRGDIRKSLVDKLAESVQFVVCQRRVETDYAKVGIFFVKLYPIERKFTFEPVVSEQKYFFPR